MGLLLPPFQFAYCTDNNGITALNTHGTAFTAGVSNADGTPVSLVTAVAHDVHRIVLSFSNTDTVNTALYMLADLLVDPAGGSSWATLIADMLVGMVDAIAGTGTPNCTFDFPLFVPAGSSFGLQARTSHSAAPTSQCSIWLFGEPSRPDMWWCGQGVETIGVTAASSRGTSVTSGASASWGSWTNVGSPSSYRFGALQMGIQGTDAGAVGQSYWFQAGAGSVLLPGFPMEGRIIDTSERGPSFKAGGPYFCDLPAGTQLQGRIAGVGGSVEPWDLAFYGVY